MSEEPWLDTWSFVEPRSNEESADVHVGDGQLVTTTSTFQGIEYSSTERARLAAAAPAMVRTLLEVEWASDDETTATCPRCGNGVAQGHEQGCRLDASLTAAGFPDRDSRESARGAMIFWTKAFP